MTKLLLVASKTVFFHDMKQIAGGLSPTSYEYFLPVDFLVWNDAPTSDIR